MTDNRGPSYEREIRELCTLADRPQKAAEYIFERRSVASVRTALANAANRNETPAEVDRKGWDQAALKAGAEVRPDKAIGLGWDRAVAKIGEGTR